ncbi:FG-GAP-like repeat-containing protein [Flexithrix dorotheae]|uniref:FG-GAP-like repeat-containing protein n=1 Tax=Flexithrix dorotheae TaxID=70993 RepID=UPI000362A484|nr:FG-GAP-like repeat-containing protein [Flexithrix dorotheae]
MLIDVVYASNDETTVKPNLDKYGGLYQPVQQGFFPRLSDGENEWGDYDADGDLDLLIAGETNGYYDPISITTSLYQNENGVFETVNTPNLMALKDNSVAWGDLDNDGDLDLVMTGRTLQDEVTIKIYQNDLNDNVFTENSKPLPPINLSDSVTGNDIFLKWEAQEDSETEKIGLTFNIFALSEDSTFFYDPPMAELETGKRQVARAGNINGGLNQWILRDLPNGKYTWGIQAIDGNYEGSKFTFGDTFKIELILPSDLKLNAITSNHIELSWEEKAEGEEGYIIERKGPGDEDFLLISSLPSNSSTFNDYEIQENSKYYYRLSIKNDNGRSGYLLDSITSLKSTKSVIENVLEGYFQTGSDWVDLDSDGYLDGIITGRKYNDSTHTFSTNTEIYTIDSNYQLIKSVTLPTNPDIDHNLLSNNLIANWIDIDNDGDFDISTTGGHTDSTLIFYENINNREFRLKYNPIFPPLGHNGLTWGDIDNDGDLDVFYSGFLIDSVNSDLIATVYLNEGNFQFSKLENNVFTGVDFSNAKWVDLNNDGKNDLIYSGIVRYPQPNGTTIIQDIVKVYINNGNLTFTELSNDLIKSWADYSVGDYDLDGFPDLLILKFDRDNYTYETYVYKNLGNFQFEEQKNNYLTFSATPNSDWKTVEWVDLNNDGFLDFIASGIWGGKGYNDFFITKGFLNNQKNDFYELIDLGINGGGGQFKFLDFDNDNDVDIFNSKINKLKFLGDYSSKIEDFANFYVGNAGVNKFKKNTSPNLPSDLTHKQSGNQIELSWSGATDAQSQVTSLTYNLEIRKGDSIIWSSQSLDNGSQLIPGAGNMGHNTKLVMDSLAYGNYKWRIQAIDPSYGASPFSEWKAFEVKKQFKITGSLLTQSGEPVNQGTIEVYQTSGDSINLFKSITLTDGNSFEFDGEENGQFILKTIPDSEKFPNLLPTYFGDALLFTEAEVIELTEDKSVTITLVEKAGEQTGNSTIEGLALETEGNEGGRLSQGFATEGTPIPALPVYLLNKEKVLVGLDTTDSNGLFQFKNINSGEYKLAADYNNKPLSLSNSLFEIAEDGQSLQLSLLVGDSLSVEITSITGLEDFEPIEGVTIYPNPVENVIQVNIQNQINGNY